MEIQNVPLEEITPYSKNPRKNDQAVHAVMESIKQCGYVAPIIVDEDGVILAGHTRYKALKNLGRTEAEVVVKNGLTEDQKRKYRLLDNKTSELAEWDFDLLAEELEGLDFGELDLEWGTDKGDSYDFSDFEAENELLDGKELVPVQMLVPAKYKESVVQWLCNGEKNTAVGLGNGVLKRCGLL